MSNKGFDDYDIEMAKWRGYVVRALEDGNLELKEIKILIKSCEDKIDAVNKTLQEKIDKVDNEQHTFKTAISIKVAEIAIAVSIITSIVFYVLTKI